MPTIQEMIQAVAQAKRDLEEAHLRLDLSRFDQLLHPDYVIIQPGGRIEGKAETIASLQIGNRSWGIARSDEMEVQVFGDTAVVVGRWRGKGQTGEIAFDYSARFLSVWVFEKGCGAMSPPNRQKWNRNQNNYPLHCKKKIPSFDAK